MKTRGLAILLLLVTALAHGQTLVITKAGYYLLLVDSAGVPTLTKFDDQHIIKSGEPPTTPTQPGPTPDPTDPVANHRFNVETATGRVADANKQNTKLALAKLYQTVAGLPVTSRDQLVQSTDLLFNALNLPAAWKTWKGEIDKSLAGFVAVDDAKKAWQVVAEVLSISAAKDGDAGPPAGTVITEGNVDDILRKLHSEKGK